MLDKTTHPFIVNTLESDPYWALVIHQTLVHGSTLWTAELEFVWTAGLEFDADLTTSSAEGLTPSEAIDRLEAELAGREYVTNPSDSDLGSHYAFCERSVSW